MGQWLMIMSGSSTLWSSSSATTHATRLATEEEHKGRQEGHCCLFCERWCRKKHHRWYAMPQNYAIHSVLTFQVNLALSFARHGYRAGILDTDIFGPSIPTLLNLSGEPRLSASQIMSFPPSLSPLTHGRQPTCATL